MKIKITILLIISLFIGANLFAQTDDQGGVSTSYDRLSISTFFIEPLDSISEKTVNRMKNLPISNKFDSHNIDISLFKIKLNHRNDNSESENISLLKILYRKFQKMLLQNGLIGQLLVILIWN
ncbi:hypothetical protein LBMAG27_19730 [Bacteroidota bacterium]|nr:hypothetical protein LBMAG27_19730 [Bacteroidota bacterium]